MYLINEWRERYEVNSKGERAKDGDKLRSGPLEFIRFKVNGFSQRSGFRRLLELGKNKAPEIFGIFCKLLEIAGDQKAEKRGQLLNEKGEVATIKDLAWITGFSKSQISNALNILCCPELAWIVNNSDNIPETPGNSPTFPGISRTLQEFNSIQFNSIQGKGSGNSPEPDIPFSEIIEDLNCLIRGHYKPNGQTTQKLIRVRWTEGFRLEDFKKVHRNKTKEWLNDPKFSKFLRPETLYGNKFESYLNQPEIEEDDPYKDCPRV